MKKLLFLLLFSALFLLNQQKSEAMGLFYSDVTYPITATGVSTADIKTLKKGEAVSKNVLFCVEWGNAGIDEAAKNGGIKQISYIDIHEKTIFIFWRKLTVTVYGE